MNDVILNDKGNIMFGSNADNVMIQQCDVKKNSESYQTRNYK